MTLTNDEYKQLCRTGATEPERRRNADYYQTRFNEPAKGVTGYHLCKHGDDRKTTKPKLRIAIIPRNGNPRLSPVVKAETLDAFWGKQ